MSESQPGLENPGKFGGIGNARVHVLRKCMDLKVNLSSIRGNDFSITPSCGHHSSKKRVRGKGKKNAFNYA